MRSAFVRLYVDPWQLCSVNSTSTRGEVTQNAALARSDYHRCARPVLEQSLSYGRSAFPLDGAADREASTRSLRVLGELVDSSRADVEGHAKSAALLLLYRGGRIDCRLERAGHASDISYLADHVDPRDLCDRAPILSRTVHGSVDYAIHARLSRLRDQRHVRCHAARALALFHRMLDCWARASKVSAVNTLRDS